VAIVINLGLMSQTTTAAEQSSPNSFAQKKLHDDFNGDGYSDLLSRNKNGIWQISFVRDGKVSHTVSPTLSVAPSWQYRAHGDFNQDGHSDILVRNQISGKWYLQLMESGQELEKGYLPITHSQSWHFMDTGDYNQDGNTDLLLRHKEGAWLIYYLDGLNVLAHHYPDFSNLLSWQYQQSADFNQDGYKDVLVRNHTSGAWYLYLQQANTISSKGKLDIVTAKEWQLKAAADFNGDGYADLLLRHDDGHWLLYYLNGRQIIGYTRPELSQDLSWQFASVGRFSQGEHTDIVLRNTQSGRLYQYIMSDQGVNSATYFSQADSLSLPPLVPIYKPVPVKSNNKRPAIKAQGPENAIEGKRLTLTAQASDADGQIVGYSWLQIAGPEVTLEGAKSSTVTFHTPAVDKETKLEFQVAATDNQGARTTENLSISITPMFASDTIYDNRDQPTEVEFLTHIDWDQDGQEDVLVSSCNDNRPFIGWYKKTDKLQPFSSIIQGHCTQREPVDFDGDGNYEFIIDSNTYLQQDSNGEYQLSTLTNSTINFDSAKIVDFNNDGYPDLITSTDAGLYLHQTSSSLWDSPTLLSHFSCTWDRWNNNAKFLAIADVNEDKQLDVVCTDKILEASLYFTGNGEGVNTPLILEQALSTKELWRKYKTDINNDHIPDIILAYRKGFSEANGNSSNINIFWYEAKADGTFSSIRALSSFTTQLYLQDLYFADMDNDGLVDIFLDSGSHDTIHYAQAYADGKFNPPDLLYATKEDANYKPWDLNHDGFPDIIADSSVVWGGSSGSPKVSTLPYDGYFSFTSPNSLQDITGNGLLDIIFKRYDSYSGKISYRVNIQGPDQTISHATGLYLDDNQLTNALYQDIDLDGDIDLVANKVTDSKVHYWSYSEGSSDLIQHSLTFNDIRQGTILGLIREKGQWIYLVYAESGAGNVNEGYYIADEKGNLLRSLNINQQDYAALILDSLVDLDKDGEPEFLLRERAYSHTHDYLVVDLKGTVTTLTSQRRHDFLNNTTSRLAQSFIYLNSGLEVVAFDGEEAISLQKMASLSSRPFNIKVQDLDMDQRPDIVIRNGGYTTLHQNLGNKNFTFQEFTNPNYSIDPIGFVPGHNLEQTRVFFKYSNKIRSTTLGEYNSLNDIKLNSQEHFSLSNTEQVFFHSEGLNLYTFGDSYQLKHYQWLNELGLQQEISGLILNDISLLRFSELDTQELWVKAGNFSSAISTLGQPLDTNTSYFDYLFTDLNNDGLLDAYSYENWLDMMDSWDASQRHRYKVLLDISGEARVTDEELWGTGYIENLEIMDFNLDGNNDIISHIHEFSWWADPDGSGGDRSNHLVSFAMGTGVGGFNTSKIDPPGDIDSSGQLPLHELKRDAFWIYSADQASVSAFYGNTQGEMLQQELLIPNLGSPQVPASLTSLDVDHDNKVDLLEIEAETKQVRWYQRLSDFEFAAPQYISAINNCEKLVLPADINLDGLQDIIFKCAEELNIYGKSSVGDSYRLQKSIQEPGSTLSNYDFADIDDDGDMDIVASFVRPDGSEFITKYINQSH